MLTGPGDCGKIDYRSRYLSVKEEMVVFMHNGMLFSQNNMISYVKEKTWEWGIIREEI